jgi:hypothetical protein
LLSAVLHRCGFRAWQMQILSLSAVGLCIGLWIRAKTVDQDERGNAERRALFVGHLADRRQPRSARARTGPGVDANPASPGEVLMDALARAAHAADR